ncbi:SMP-30/gluconolactonase/LRE family protein [Thalassotalea piscium]
MLSRFYLHHVYTIFIVFMMSACQSSIKAEQVEQEITPAFIMPDADETVGVIEIYDPKALELITEETIISVRGKGFNWVEGPVWIKEHNFLLFTDIPDNIIRKFDIENGSSVYLENVGFDTPSSKGPGANGLLINKQNQLVMMRTGSRTIAAMNSDITAPKNSFTTLASHYHNMQLNGTNDGVMHSDGSIYFTDPPIGLDFIFDTKGQLKAKNKHAKNKVNKRIQQTPYAGIYRLSTSGELTLLDKTLTVPNGIGLSPDEKTLYVAVSDTEASAWYAFDVLKDGSLANKRKFYDAQHLINQKGEQGFPDGMAVHSSGVIFATGPGGVLLFDEQGTVLAKIRTGLPTSNCTFTSDEKYLFITADDYLLSIALN